MSTQFQPVLTTAQEKEMAAIFNLADKAAGAFESLRQRVGAAIGVTKDHADFNMRTAAMRKSEAYAVCPKGRTEAKHASIQAMFRRACMNIRRERYPNAETTQAKGAKTKAAAKAKPTEKAKPAAKAETGWAFLGQLQSAVEAWAQEPGNQELVRGAINAAYKAATGALTRRTGTNG